MNDSTPVAALGAEADDELSFLAGGSEMAKVVREKDWSKTPLGPIESWPQSLRTTVSLVLNSNFPIALAWGPNRIQIYNDGYWPICAAKHPGSMGQDFRECWFSAWDAIGGPFDQATAGKTAFLENQRMYLDRRGYLEETFFTFSFSPIRDETGKVAGLFHPVTELTQETLAKRRLKVLRDLADHVAEAESVEEAMRRIGESLASAELDLPFALLYLLDSDGKRARLVAKCGIESAELAPTEVNLQSAADDPWPLARAAASGRIERLDDQRRRFGDVPCGPYPEAPQHVYLLPVVLPGLTHPVAICVAGVSSRRPLDEAYDMFYGMLREGLTAALGNARAYEEERRRAEALAEVDRAKTAFFSNVSHEFRTPLTLMLGPVGDTLSDPQVPAPVRERLELAHRNALRLLKLVNSLLDFSRIEAGRVQASYEPTDLAALTRDLASTFRSAIERAGLAFDVQCAELAEQVYVDREMWEKIVLNLLSNAFKFTLHGRIEVVLRTEAEHAVLEVRDTGVGVSEADLARLFERFYRVEGTHGRTHEGSGIGLALVQELVRLHGGSIGVASTQGEGTTFTVRLPFGSTHLPADRVRAQRALASTAIGAQAFVQEALRWLPDAPRETPPVAQSDGAPSPHERRFASTFGARVVLADDNADMRAYVEELLAPYYSVEAVPDGEEALAACRRKAPELLLTDVMMPRLDGFGLLSAIRGDATLKTLPVMLLSARAGEESRVEGLDAGADDYLIKPFSARELIARVGAIIERERLRRESEARFRSMADSAPVMVWVSEPGGGCTFLSKGWRELTGQSSEAGLGAGWADVVHPADRSLVIETFNDANARREPFRVEFRLRRKASRDYAHVITAASPRFDEGGRFLGFVGSVLDIDERKALEAEREMLLEAERAARTEAESATRLKDEFLATLSHELRTPLSVIVGYSRVLLHKYAPGNEELTKGLKLIVDNAMSQSQIITDLLDMSRIVRGKVTLDARLQQLDALVESCVSAQRPAAEARGIELAFDSSLSGSATVLADAARLQQVLHNLLSNAIKFTPAEGRITVATRGAADGYEIVVRDTGEGIPPEMLPHVFERFRQGDGSSARRHGGLGLGLAIVKQLVELHGGAVRAESEGRGRGATFTVWLPLAADALAASIGGGEDTGARKPVVLLEPDTLRGIEVLVIEDEPAMLEYTRRLLAEHGAVVQGFTSARAALEALRILERSSHRLVLVSDLGMPELDGFALIRTVRNEMALPAERLPAIAVTAFARDEDRERTLAAGYQGYLAKPFEAAQLITAVRQLATRDRRSMH